jgi:hypothetical protein
MGGGQYAGGGGAACRAPLPRAFVSRSHLMRAERRSPEIDILYLIYQARKTAEDSSGSRGQSSALQRVAFEKWLGDARK